MRTTLDMLHALRDVRDERLTSTHRLVLAMMLAFRNGDGEHVRPNRRGACDPSVAQVSASAALSPRHARRVLAELRACGYLAIRHPATARTGVVYDVVLPSRVDAGDTPDVHVTSVDGGSPDLGDTPGMTPMTARGDAGNTPGVTPTSASADLSADRTADPPAVARARAKGGGVLEDKRTRAPSAPSASPSTSHEPADVRDVVVETYEQAVRDAKESIGAEPRFSLAGPGYERNANVETLQAIVAEYARTPDGTPYSRERALAWLHDAVDQFIRDREVTDYATRFSSFAPKGLRFWLNQGRYRRSVRPAPLPPPKPKEIDTRTPEERLAHVRKIFDGVNRSCAAREGAR